MVIDGAAVQSITAINHQRLMIFLGLWRQRTCSVSLGLDDGSITVANTITDEIIGEYDTKCHGLMVLMIWLKTRRT